METCTHCDEIALPAVYGDGDEMHARPFCCEGCIAVYNVLHLKGFEAYYDIKKNSAIFKRRSPVELRPTRFDFLDDVEVRKEFSYANSDGLTTMEFYLEGIHCLACLWLIEKLPEFLSGVYSSKLDLERSVVTVELGEHGKFSLVAKEFHQLGYRPHPLKRNQDVANLKTREERAFLVRIGIAGAATGNIMIYAVSLYAGADGGFGQLFNLLTVVFAVPVLTYCAYPFYHNAWSALRNKTLSIDIPISLSLIVGGVMGLTNLWLGVLDNYFDSLTALVFLLLMSRYFLQKIQEKGLSATDLHFFYQSDSVLREERGEFREIHPRSIKSDDVLQILPGQFIPADGIVLRGASNLNNSLLTGESLPVKVTAGDSVFSGTENLDQELVIKVQNVAEDSRIGRLLKNVENGWVNRSKIINLTNRVSKYFTLTVFLLAGILFFKLLQAHDFRHAFEGALTLLIVTCPCALALAVPLTFTRALATAAEQGIIIKSDEVIEKLAEVKHVFIDKTGTITLGKLAITDFQAMGTSVVPLKDVIHNLEVRSRHPVALALKAFIKGSEQSSLPVVEYRETLGTGVSGTIEGHFYEIKKERIFQDGVPVAEFQVADTVRPDSAGSVAALTQRGLGVSILSGDRVEVVERIAAQVSLPMTQALAELGPEAKSELIKKTPGSMMIGDGANDAIALGNAHVGVAVHGAMDISLRAADVYLTTPGLVPVEKLLILASETMRVIRRNLVLSLCYNSLSVLAAFHGYISPLVAAIIMPVSSLTVLLSTLAGTKKLRRLWKY